MYKYILRRFFSLIPVLLGITLVVFLIIHYAPGDPVANMMGEAYFDQGEYERLQHELGFDRPVMVQYLNWLGRIARGEFGNSLIRKRPVLDLIFERFPNTLILAGTGVFFALIIAIPIGILTAVYQDSWIDNIGRIFALLGVSMPAFWRGMMLMLVFSWYIRIFPSGGSISEKGIVALILPSISLGISLAAIVMRMTRSSMLEVLRQDFITTARAKGLAEATVLFKHSLKNALIPVVTVVGLQIGYLMGTGAILTETVFSWPGLGRLIVQAINERDVPLVQGLILFVALMFVLVNLLVDVIYVYLDPRIEYK
ncbi:peptide ABC transporter [candidate division KSB3 bacterium]|uniref:Peptide ABC transporter n=1 Tax=candidate division KSB3 bacterium TaxID=2044937 RepID=A0A2G6KFW2_9BACT|nr:MAG: peptide ABC transporter [candidate division KSB3 bacterium]